VIALLFDKQVKFYVFSVIGVALLVALVALVMRGPPGSSVSIRAGEGA
jgi:hypothetical protein